MFSVSSASRRTGTLQRYGSHIQDRTFATVTMMGEYGRIKGTRYTLKKLWGIKVANQQEVARGHNLVKNRRNNVQYWPGKNVVFSYNWYCVSTCRGKVCWSYDPKYGRRYVNVIPEGEEEDDDILIPKPVKRVAWGKKKLKQRLKHARKDRLEELVNDTQGGITQLNTLLCRPSPQVGILNGIIKELTSQSQTLVPPERPRVTFPRKAALVGEKQAYDLID